MTVLSLVEKGVWDLDEPLAKYWVDLDVTDDPRHQRLTSRMVLRQRSGFPNWRGGEPLTFLYDPGSKQSYSGEGFEYMRRAIETKFGRSFEDIAREQVFEPVGMTYASYLWPEWVEGRFVGKYYADYLFDYWDDNDGKPPTEVSAAADFITRLRDLAKFAIWSMVGAGLSDELWTDMTTPNDRSLLVDPKKKPLRNGLGWFIYPETDNTPLVMEHGGSERGIRATLIMVPERQDALIVLTNGSGGVPIIRAVYDATLGRELDHPAVEAEMIRWGAFDQ